MVNEIKLRRSVRKYSDKVISESDMLEIIEAACMAPSAMNQQPWRFKIASDPETKKKVAHSFLTTRFTDKASHIVLYLMDTKCIVPGMAPMDVASAVTISLLEAQNKGIGSCWCGVWPNEKRMEKCKEIFDIKEKRYVPMALVAFGYPKDENAFHEVKRNYEGCILK